MEKHFASVWHCLFPHSADRKPGISANGTERFIEIRGAMNNTIIFIGILTA
jgi:hypothetical protein